MLGSTGEDLCFNLVADINHNTITTPVGYNGQDATFKLDNSPAANAGFGGVGFDDLDDITIYTAVDDKG